MDRLRGHVDADAEAIAITFLSAGERRVVELSNRQLFVQATSLAVFLRSDGPSGAQVIVALPPGPEFIVAFVSCLLAGAVAVPSPPVRVGDIRSWERLEAIAQDSGATVIVAPDDMFEARSRPEIQHLSIVGVRWISPSRHADEACSTTTACVASSTAFLQYTSGSTGSPKGVAVSHENLAANLMAIGKKLRVNKDSVAVSWLPMHHDWGLVGVVLASLFHGNRMVLMSPLHFAQKPARWLAAISAFSGTHTGAPNFAYELCTKRIKDADLETLDLRSLEVAGCGAEPVRPQALQDFCARFARAGFRSQSFYPCYGLAEATLLVSGADQPRASKVLRVSQHDLGEGEVAVTADDSGKAFVNCGSAAEGHDLRIVNPTSLRTCPEGRVGEVWFRGPSVATGYWGRVNDEVTGFAAVTAEGEAAFLRTGDLGFLQDGDLYLVGRLKEVIIVNGRKIHPQDIEWTSTSLGPPTSFGRAAAFSSGDFDDLRLTLVLELKHAGYEDVAALPLMAFNEIVRAHEVAPRRVIIVKPGALPITTSGKIRRGQARAMLLNNEFDIQAEYVAK